MTYPGKRLIEDSRYFQKCPASLWPHLALFPAFSLSSPKEHRPQGPWPWWRSSGRLENWR
jgi:hypothetical protein